MKIVILGSGGRLGAAMCRGYSSEGEITGFNHSQLDLASPDAIDAALDPLEFDLLINSAALTNVDYCETHEAEAMAVNAHAVRRIAEHCARKNARCIHISTDYVFDGAKREPYTEADQPKPISIYGASKHQGEIELSSVSDAFLSVRVSWVFGPDRPSFVDQILKRAQETDQLQAIGDKWSTPSYTADIVEALRPLLRSDAGGVLNVTQTGACTWQEYGQFALDCATELGLPLKGRTVGFQAMADLKAFIAKRPVYTVLSTDRLTSLTSKPIRSWQEAVRDYIGAFYAPKS
jgi:dTDP-4-dehydrorhamnose reductase